MHLDVTQYYDTHPKLQYDEVKHGKFVSKKAFGDVFPHNNVERLVTGIKKERNDTTCVCTDTKLELVDNTYMTQAGNGYQNSRSKLLGNTLPLGKMESETLLVKTELTGTPDPAGPTLCDKRCMYDSYVAVNADSGLSHYGVTSITSISPSVKANTPTVAPEHGTTPPNGRARTGDKPHTCDTCMKSYAHKSKLEIHTRTHTGNKPYTCDVCIKSFAKKSDLVAHTRIHTGGKPHTCDVCRKSFRQAGTLTRHIITHTGDKPYTCDVCMKSFSRK
jgi:hypothetical protein